MRTGRRRSNSWEASAAAPLQRRRRIPLISAFDTSSSSRRGPRRSAPRRLRRGNNLTEGVAAEASGEIQSMTMLASTTGIEFAGSLAAVGEHEIGGRPAPALRPAQNLLREPSPLPPAEGPVPCARQGLDG